MPKERKFKIPLSFFTRHPDASVGDILSWGCLEDLKVYAVKREYGVQYFKYLKNTKTLPWWGMEELAQTNILYYGVRFYKSRLWVVMKYQVLNGFPDWKPHYPKKEIKIDPVTRKKDITLHVKRP
ncbi:hypothetical protein Hanom_Chr02g00136071 [Helianthus anomalus]